MLELLATEPYTKALVGILKQEKPEIVLLDDINRKRPCAGQVHGEEGLQDLQLTVQALT